MAGPTRFAGYPDYSSGGASKFIPEIWSGKMVEKFYASTVFAEISNNDYEGEISGLGDNVIIRRTPDITVAAYQIGMTLTYQKPTKDATNLPINKALYWAAAVNSVDRYQSDLALMDNFTDDASYQVKIEQDQDVLGNIYADVDADNSGTTAGVVEGNVNLGAVGASVQITSANAVDHILDHGQVLDEQNVPETGRWIVLPSWYIRKLKSSDLKDASVTGDGVSVLRNGRAGMIDRFTVYQSNNLARVVDGANTVTQVLAGHKAGLTWASQIVETEDLANPTDFGRLVRGLLVYGYKVVEGKYLTHGRVRP